ncbi:hypothetical protein ACX4M5_05865 [Roseomonas mucosa]|jgi:hypothetical protein|uniref:hypothetical protein n=1 Tax=Roseomonas mucosa TaxID=207340 RepID=UPI000DB65B7F|nr:hypothetical protein [Roseomonas mucosa]MCG7354667.1 hypothetical protein [Roseomonas mucosa]MDT8355992.1 hypothetical protein [Roseomonas mucosa]PZR09458.1 MAG: hypothetical protein DI532_20275 [Azospirillum brasilense]
MVILTAVCAATTFLSTAMATPLRRIMEDLGAAPAAATSAASQLGAAQVAAPGVDSALFRKP